MFALGALAKWLNGALKGLLCSSLAYYSAACRESSFRCFDEVSTGLRSPGVGKLWPFFLCRPLGPAQLRDAVHVPANFKRASDEGLHTFLSSSSFVGSPHPSGNVSRSPNAASPGFIIFRMWMCGLLHSFSFIVPYIWHSGHPYLEASSS